MTRKLGYEDTHDVQGVKFGLENIHELLKSLGDPHKELKVVHIAGTNGKGSVGAYLSYILDRAGYMVGRLSSPAVFSKYEFAQIYNNGCIEEIDKEYLDEKLSYIQRCKLDIEPSGFEVQVAISFSYFKELQTDIVIVETGMGGILDATNVFDSTLCDVLTSIGIDHKDYLGPTIEDITKVKCGIITTDSDVVTLSSNIDSMDIISKECCKRGAKLHIADINEIKETRYVPFNNTFIYKNDMYTIRQNGSFQLKNVILAIEVIQILNNKGYRIPRQAIIEGLRDTYILGRFDIIKNMTYVLDGAHNEQGMEALLQSVEEYFGCKKIILLMNVFKDKEYSNMVRQLVNKVSKTVLFNRDNIRSIDSKILRDEFIAYGMKLEDIVICKDLDEGIKEGQRLLELVDDSIVVCAGSLSYMKELYERLL